MARNPTRTVYIGNLDEKVTERILYEILIQPGRVVDLYIPCDKETSYPKGYGFAEYETEEIAQYAVQLFSGLVRLYGKTLKFAISGQDKPSSNGSNPVMPKLNTVPLPKQPQFVQHSDMPVLHTPAYPMHYQLDPCIATEGSAMVWRLCFECCWPWSSEASNVVSVLLGTKEGNLLQLQSLHLPYCCTCTFDGVSRHCKLTTSKTKTTHARTRTFLGKTLIESIRVCMISRRSKPREEAMMVESPRVQQAAAGEEGGGGGSVFFCVAVTSRGRTDRLSYFQAEGDGDNAEEVARATTALCLDHAPEHHHWHHHTVVGRRTFAFLAGDDGRTYFAVADPTPGSAEMVRFLQCVHDAFGGAPRRRNQRDDAVDAVVWQFVRALRASAGRGSTLFPGDSRGGGDASSADGDKDEEEDDRGGEVMPVAAEGARWRTRRSWWRYSKVVIGVELVLFLVLFVVWMIVCNGFNCVQR
uniref:RRM domain-containing protein n=1 Tax=Oryza punctata TaxID=4537 RepID=A0A0E0JRQ5_ORYPU